MTEWQTTSAGNEILEGGGFFISYRADTRNMLGAPSRLFAGDQAEETALVHRNGAPRFLILNGDHRSEYEKALPDGYEACRAVYESHRAISRSSWSGDTPMEETLGAMFQRLGED